MVRLVSGSNTAASSGRLQVQISGLWQQMVAPNFDSTAAAVVCRQLGLVGGPATWSRGLPTAASQCARLGAPIHPSYCTADIATLHDCPHLTGNTACDDSPVIVTCTLGAGAGPPCQHRPLLQARHGKDSSAAGVGHWLGLI